METSLTIASVAQIVILPLFPSDIYKKYISFFCGLVQVGVLALVSIRWFHLRGNLLGIVYISCVALLCGSASTSLNTRYGLMAALASTGVFISSLTQPDLGEGSTVINHVAMGYVLSSVNLATLLLAFIPYEYLHLSKYELIILSNTLFACIDDCLNIGKGTGSRGDRSADMCCLW